MYVLSLDASPSSQTEARLEQMLLPLRERPAAWILMYATVDAKTSAVMGALGRIAPGVSIFGCTSFQGVFTAQGFFRGITLLIAEPSDQLPASLSLEPCGPHDAFEHARNACIEIERSLGRRPDALLLHATPGFEERILAGVKQAFGTDVPVYGGSAADDTISGEWRVFANGADVREGFLLVGLCAEQPLRGAFLGGYLPTEHSGIITRADGRTVFQIDERPAASVYNAWTRGAIADELKAGGSVLLKTNMLPVARTVGTSAMPRRILSHPHEVDEKTGALKFFSEFTVGDRITLMTSTKDPLITRVRRTVQRARAGNPQPTRGGLLVYCGGCLGALLDRAPEIAREFGSELGDVPFVGLATFGEQGRFFDKSESRHGNLMCTVFLF